MKLKYIKVGDYKLPNLTLNTKRNGEINKYGLLRLDYLKENKKSFYTILLIENKLTDHLISVSKESEKKLNILMKQYKKIDEKLSEKNKEINQMRWVQLMNNYKNMAEEMIINELIYV